MFANLFEKIFFTATMLLGAILLCLHLANILLEREYNPYKVELVPESYELGYGVKHENH